MTLDVVICTYNRQKKVIDLVNQLLTCTPLPDNIIIVDSSDESNLSFDNNTKIKYIKSPRKSQPYQRYIGAQCSNAEIICYFDDDIVILEKSLFSEIKKGFENKSVSGVSLGIQYETGININQIKSKKNQSKTGEISWLGKTSGLPEKIDFVQYFPGPIMAFKNSIILNLFNEHLFTIFEKKIAMGEDKYISMQAGIYGKLLFLGDKTYIYHPPEPSTYFNNEIDFIAKTTFSRLWLSKQFAKTHGKPIWKAYLIFSLYLFKQLLTGLIYRSRLKGNIKAIKWLYSNQEK